MNKFLSIITKIFRPAKVPLVVVSPPPSLEPITKSSFDHLVCPYCQSKEIIKRGFRQKKLEKVQLFECHSCSKTFTPRITKGKHYPLDVMLDAISIYNLGYSLEETCRLISKRHTLAGNSGGFSGVAGSASQNRENRLWRGFFRPSGSILKRQNCHTYKHSQDNEADPKSGVGKNSSLNHALNLHAKNQLKTQQIPVNNPLHTTTPISFLSTNTAASKKANDTDPALTPISRNTRYSALENLAIVDSQTHSNTIDLSPSTLSHWLKETEDLCRFARYREYAIKLCSPKDMILHTTLVHQQLYRYRFHRAKCELIIREDIKHRRFGPLKEFLEMIPTECPHHYFQEAVKTPRGWQAESPDSPEVEELGSLRASEAPLTFSKKQMIVRAKQNYATRLCAFVLQSVKDRKGRHEALQKFMISSDSVTVATEVPVYLTRDDLEHMQTQLGFQMYYKPQQKTTLSGDSLGLGDAKSPKSVKPNYVTTLSNSLSSDPMWRRVGDLHSIPTRAGTQSLTDLAPSSGVNPPPNSEYQKETDGSTSPIPLPKLSDVEDKVPAENCSEVVLPKLITGHIDLLQIRNGQIHILDYKPEAEKERPIEQLTLYAMALSRLTGLRLFEFKCAWFDEKDYFEFYPLHVLHKPKKTHRRRKVYTMEGLYKINQDENKILSVRPAQL